MRKTTSRTLSRAVIVAGIGLALTIAVATAGMAQIPASPRLPPLKESDLTAEQKKAWDEITKTFGVPPGGPFMVFVHRAGVGEGAALMYKEYNGPKQWGWDDPEQRLPNLAIIMVAQHWGANLEWCAHAKSAIKSGVSPEVVEAIRVGKKPTFTREDERVVYDTVQQLLVGAKMSRSTYDKAVAVLGTEPLVGIVTEVGFYSMIAISLVAFDNTVPARMVYLPLPARKE
jgi:4-carboxymuconolactone decarboxylase